MCDYAFFQFAFEAVIMQPNTYLGDIAIDEVAFDQAKCEDRTSSATVGEPRSNRVRAAQQPRPRTIYTCKGVGRIFSRRGQQWIFQGVTKRVLFRGGEQQRRSFILPSRNYVNSVFLKRKTFEKLIGEY